MKKNIQHFDVFRETETTGVIYKNRTQKKAMIRYIDQHGLSTITEMSQELKASLIRVNSGPGKAGFYRRKKGKCIRTGFWCLFFYGC